MDIFNINIHNITNQYLEYIKTMRRLDLEVAGEFVAMAATLLHIKSRMLLPQYTEEGEEIAEDPRKDLVQKLLEYKKYKELSVDLNKRSLLGRDVFVRGERTAVESLEEGEVLLEQNPLFSLIAAYRVAVKNMKKTVHRVFGELQSIAARILEMREQLVIGRRMIFREMITDTGPGSNQVLVTFLSLLELAKMGFVSIFQNEPLSDIYIDPLRPIDRDIVSQVESYDNVNSELKAEAILNEAAAAARPGEVQLSLDEAEFSSDEDSTTSPSTSMGDEALTDILPDSATDDDIEAEELRIAAEDQTDETSNRTDDPSPSPDRDPEVAL